MSDATAALIARIRAGREHWLELDERRSVKWRSPGWEEQGRMISGGMDRMRVAVGCVTDWRGFAESDVLPDGGDKRVEFSRELWEIVLADNMEWLPKLLEAVVDDMTARNRAQEAAAGN